jgi:SAM-dependent methyltransferase
MTAVLMTRSSEFWDALAPYHSALENSYLDLPSLRRVLHDIHPPVLVVGAGQGLIVAELRKRGIQCDGVDLSREMIRYARIRRGLDLIRADAGAMPLGNGTYQTIIYATGVVDFMSDEEQIRLIFNEGRRIAVPSGTILVAFCKFSAATEELLIKLGLLSNNVVRLREILEIYRLNPVQTIAWAAKRAKVGFFRAAVWSIRSWAFSSWQEKRNAVHMQRIFAQTNQADALIQAAPEEQTYRNEAEIRNLFARLAIPIKQLGEFGNCIIAQI